MRVFRAVIEVMLYADDESQANQEAERIAFREDGGSVLSVEELDPDTGLVVPPAE